MSSFSPSSPHHLVLNPGDTAQRPVLFSITPVILPAGVSTAFSVNLNTNSFPNSHATPNPTNTKSATFITTITPQITTAATAVTQ